MTLHQFLQLKLRSQCSEVYLRDITKFFGLNVRNYFAHKLKDYLIKDDNGVHVNIAYIYKAFTINYLQSKTNTEKTHGTNPTESFGR